MSLNKKLYTGFTIGEVLLTMAIVITIAVLMAPIVGVKKVKYPINKIVHGTFQCYYQNGVLMQYYANNSELRKAEPQPSPSQDRCEFDAPKANYFEVITVGPGGAGYDNVSQIDYAIDNTHNTGGGLYADSNFQSSIDAAGTYAGLIRQTLNEWSSSRSSQGGLLVGFSKIQSPLGKGGAGNCQVGVYNNVTPECAENCSIINDKCKGPYGNGSILYRPPTVEELAASGTCWYVVHGKGGPSGYGNSTNGTKLFPITGDSSISVKADSEGAGVTIGDNSIMFGKSSDGVDAYPTLWTGSFFVDGDGYTQNAPCVATGKFSCDADTTAKSNTTTGDGRQNGGTSTGKYNGGMSCSANEKSEDRFGAVSYLASPAFSWTFTTLVAHSNYATAGKHGNENVKVYEKLAGRLYLYPGKNGSPSMVAQDATKTEVIARAEAGQQGNLESDNFELVPANIPYLSKQASAATPDNSTMTWIGRVGASGFTKGLFNCERATGTSSEGRVACPGMGGFGFYPFITNVSGNNILKITDNQGINGGSITKTFDSGLGNTNNSSKCKGGQAPVNLTARNYRNPVTGQTISYQVKYCKDGETSGNNGAIIILW